LRLRVCSGFGSRVCCDQERDDNDGIVIGGDGACGLVVRDPRAA
jgi:hypothetical protein